MKTNMTVTKYAVFYTNQFGFSSRIGETYHTRGCHATRELNQLTKGMSYARRINYDVRPVVLDREFNTPWGTR